MRGSQVRILQAAPFFSMVSANVSRHRFNRLPLRAAIPSASKKAVDGFQQFCAGERFFQNLVSAEMTGNPQKIGVVDSPAA